MKSTMFLNNTTSIDHAYIDSDGMVVGGSFSPEFLVSGKVDPTENVVVDFSQVKKQIKQIIDDKAAGFDHKLWIIEGYSNAKVTYFEGDVGVNTPLLAIRGKEDMVKVIHANGWISNAASHQDLVLLQLNQEIEDKLNEMNPGVAITMETKLSPAFTSNQWINSGLFPFRYVHGLRDSTSYGCQNIAHGHLSFLGAGTTNEVATNLLLMKIASELDLRIFAWKKNVMTMGDRSLITYTSGRGNFAMSLTPKAQDHLVLLPTETTVEHLAGFVRKMWKAELEAAGVYELFVSEGQNKGAMVELD